MSRTERRNQLKTIVKGYQKVGVDPTNHPTIIGLTHQLIEVLESRTNPHRAAEAGAMVTESFERTMKLYGHKGEGIACRKGCDHCCRHTYASVSVPEVFRLARHMSKAWREDEGLRTRYAAAETLTRGIGYEERHEGRQPCPLLVDQACSIHAARPLTCRAFVSMSLDACIASFNLESHEIPAPRVNRLARAAHVAALKAALKATGLDSSAYELGHTLHLALTLPNAEARWLGGEDIFNVVAKDPDDLFEVPDDMNARFVTVLAAAAQAKEMPENPWFRWG